MSITELDTEISILLLLLLLLLQTKHLTVVPAFMSTPNQTGLPELGLALVHQDFLGTLAGLAEMQVSPVSMSQKTLMASLALPPSGSIQYSPGRVDVWVTQGQKAPEADRTGAPTAALLRVSLSNVLAGPAWVCSAPVGTAHVRQMPPEALQCGVDSSVCVHGRLVSAHLWSS